MNENIFREYDIRGVVEADFTPEVVQNIARSFATYLLEMNLKNCVLGFDARLSADYLFSTFSDTLMKCGIDVTSIGQVTTPMLYFARENLNSDSAVMITGSHNPADMNGFKIITRDEAIYGEKIQYLKNLILNGKLTADANTKGKLDSVSIKENYFDYLKGNINVGDRKLKVVIDGGNGTGGEVAAEMFRHYGCEVVEMYTKPDGNFPNHHPDPTVPKYMTNLIAKVTEIKADLGIGYDGDADRIGVVDNTGKLLFGDQLMILFSREILSRKPGSTVIGEVKCSKTLYDEIEKAGGKGVMWKAGHSLIKAKMKETHAELGGEVSGHIFFKDRFFGHDDALYASLRLLEILSRTEKSISELLSDVPKTYMTPELRGDFPDDVKFEVVKKVTDYFKKNNYNVCDVDGMRVIFDDGFGLVRASNTQPALVQRYEALTEERANEIKDLVQSKLEEFSRNL
ncbi:MAG: phosphomannomutase/phosphoglucomutase [Candidatus Delongbacteria bacterium]|nr:phosphomannomutase/phosphoglucomutase [Candidatus Delongbacteria bacterium]MBN2834511.1 phosphomannomutase/phosphoglucomutase [Candidatus Delongbacteria bacterium]